LGHTLQGCLEPKSTTTLSTAVSHPHIRVYDWDGLKELTVGSGLHLDHDVDNEKFDIERTYLGWNGNILITKHKEMVRVRPIFRIVLWMAKDISDRIETKTNQGEAPPLSVYPVLNSLGEILSHLIGTFGKVIGFIRDHFIFLDHDGWVCSVDMADSLTVPDTYKRHFFLPSDWLSTNDDLLFAITDQQDILFAKDHELAVIKRGLECVEVVPFPEFPQKPEEDKEQGQKELINRDPTVAAQSSSTLCL